MKTLIMTAIMIPGLALAYHEGEPINRIPLPDPMAMPRVAPIENSYDRIESQYGPAVVVPVQPSTRGSSYIGNDQIRTPEVECYRSVATGAMVCQPY